MDEREPHRTYRGVPLILEIVTRFLFATLLLGGCEEAPAEPAGTPAPKAAPSVKELAWTVPPTWSLVKAAGRGEYRAKYTIPHQGDAKTSAELLVKRLGGSRNVTAAKAALDELAGEFEGPKANEAKRRAEERAGHPVEILEIEGTYRMGMGPKRKGRAMAAVIKEDWAGLGAAVITDDRGTWLFRLVGPQDAVEAARSSFFNVLDGLE